MEFSELQVSYQFNIHVPASVDAAALATALNMATAREGQCAFLHGLLCDTIYRLVQGGIGMAMQAELMSTYGTEYVAIDETTSISRWIQEYARSRLPHPFVREDQVTVTVTDLLAPAEGDKGKQ